MEVGPGQNNLQTGSNYPEGDEEALGSGRPGDDTEIRDAAEILDMMQK